VQDVIREGDRVIRREATVSFWGSECWRLNRSALHSPQLYSTHTYDDRLH
jgi:hypothetical protein